MKFGKYLLRLLVASTFLFSATSHSIPVPDDDGNSGAWITNFLVSYSFAKVGKPVVVQWGSAFTVGCRLWTSQNGSRSVSTAGVTTVTPTSSGTMSVRLNCSGINGQSVSQTRSFSVNKFDHPELLSLSLVGKDAEAPWLPREVVVTWSSSFSDYCEMTGTYSETLPTSGTRNFAVIAGQTIIKMTCKRYDGRSSNKLFRSLYLPSIEYFYAHGSHPSSDRHMLEWNAHGDTCKLDGMVVDRKDRKTVIKGDHTLTCYLNGYSVTRRVYAYLASDSLLDSDPILLGDDVPVLNLSGEIDATP